MIMNRNKVNYLVEYLSPTLILSYFFFKNIIPVLLGILLSLYLINISLVNSLMILIKHNISKGKDYIKKDRNDSTRKEKTSQIKIDKENSKLTLVETVEELGFIPSLDENKDSNAA